MGGDAAGFESCCCSLTGLMPLGLNDSFKEAEAGGGGSEGTLKCAISQEKCSKGRRVVRVPSVSM